MDGAEVGGAVVDGAKVNGAKTKTNRVQRSLYTSTPDFTQTVTDRNALLLLSYRTSCVGFRLAYLYLTLVHSKNQVNVVIANIS